MQDYSGYGQPPRTGSRPCRCRPCRPTARRRIGAFSYLFVALGPARWARARSWRCTIRRRNTSAVGTQPSSGALTPAPLPSGAIPQPSARNPGVSASEQDIVNKVAPGLVIINTTLQYRSERAAAPAW